MDRAIDGEDFLLQRIKIGIKEMLPAIWQIIFDRHMLDGHVWNQLGATFRPKPDANCVNKTSGRFRGPTLDIGWPVIDCYLSQRIVSNEVCPSFTQQSLTGFWSMVVLASYLQKCVYGTAFLRLNYNGVIDIQCISFYFFFYDDHINYQTWNKIIILQIVAIPCIDFIFLFGVLSLMLFFVLIAQI